MRFVKQKRYKTKRKRRCTQFVTPYKKCDDKKKKKTYTTRSPVKKTGFTLTGVPRTIISLSENTAVRARLTLQAFPLSRPSEADRGIYAAGLRSVCRRVGFNIQKMFSRWSAVAPGEAIFFSSCFSFSKSWGEIGYTFLCCKCREKEEEMDGWMIRKEK